MERRVALLAAEARSYDVLAGQVLEPLRRQMGASYAAMFRFVPSPVLSGTYAVNVAEYAQRFMTDDPLLDAQVGARAWLRRPTATVSRKRFQRSGAYEHCYRPHELEDVLVVVLNDLPPRRNAGVMLWRPPGARAWDEHDEHVVRQSGLLLRAAAKRLLHSDGSPRETHEIAEHEPWVTYDRDARLKWRSPLAPSPPDWVRDHARALLRFTRGRGAAAPDGVVEREGLRAEFHLGEGPSALVRLTAAAPAAPEAHLRAMRRHALTVAEARVLAGLLAGGSHGDIAASLGVSIDTVRTHLRCLFAKMGVRSSLQAALAALRA